MIEEGNMHRHLKKSIQIYRQRRDILCERLAHHFPNAIKYSKPTGGLAVWVEFTDKLALSKVAAAALNHDLTIPRNILYQNKDITAMRIGFGHMNEEEIQQSIALLSASIVPI